jgi:ubiquinone/menaquinone biosynthesis C-methylase UbiE
MSDQVDLRTELRDRWAQAAPGWNAHRDVFRTLTLPVSSRLIDAVSPQPGQTILELAAGVGDVGFLAAELIKPNGTLICSDFSPEMLTAAQERAQELKIDNVRFRQIDAESIDLETASIDAIICRWGYMLMPDPQAALRESRRVLKQGGRLAFAAWTGPEQNMWASVGRVELAKAGAIELPDESSSDQFVPGQFAWANKQDIIDALNASGFTDFSIERVSFPMYYPSFEEWWQSRIEMAPSICGAICDLSADRQAEVEVMARETLTPFTQPDQSIAFTGETWVAVAELAV